MKNVYIAGFLVSVLILIIGCSGIISPTDPFDSKYYFSDNSKEISTNSKSCRIITFYGKVVESLTPKMEQGLSDVLVIADIYIPEDDQRFSITAVTNKTGSYTLTVEYYKEIKNLLIILHADLPGIYPIYTVKFIDGKPIGYYDYYVNRKRLMANFWFN
ncbi:MAG: hypothetical protein PHV06_03455 [bacterium]|nr:hypothetical protein [bacterium]